VASHGCGHELVYRLGPEKFREDIRRSKNHLEDLCGRQVSGYRAPSYSITGKSLWALDILVEAGYTFDSSIFPVYHDTYGIPDALRFPHEIKLVEGKMMEFPLSTLPVRFAGREYRFPIAGGGYLRLLPASMICWGIKRINTLENKPAVLYFHPWEIDPDQPRIKTGLKSRFRHYLNLHSTEARLRDLLSSISFVTMGDVLDKNSAEQ
jgi:polysaccharide deacetylase family protein (PEP-CTERM system associated)